MAEVSDVIVTIYDKLWLARSDGIRIDIRLEWVEVDRDLLNCGETGIAKGG